MNHRELSITTPSRIGPRLCLTLLLAAGQANAQWQVTDEVTHEGLQRVDETIKNQTNKRLEEIRDQEKIGSAKRSTDGAQEKPDEPGVTLEKDKPATIQSTLTVEQLRCGQSPEQGVLRDRWTVCTEIVKTELAQYNYALSMREVALQRQTRLKAIEDARTQFQNQDAGKLQSNSNELLALLARMEADKQQYRTYMDAYAARVTYLRALGESLGQQAINGSSKPTLGEAALGVASLAALKVALEAQRTEKKATRFGD